MKSFKKIGYYAEKHDDEHLGEASDLFAKKLKNYVEKFPATISYPFYQLKKEPVTILTSADGLFRIYSWDDETGGTMRYFDNIFQYKIAGRAEIIAAINKPEGESGSMYQELYTFKANGKTYYLATTLEIGSTIIYVNGIQVFSIEGGKLNPDTKIIRTKSGLHSTIDYEYNPTLTADEKISSYIHFDHDTQSIYIPIVLEKGKLTNKYILYKFTGQYFERVKN
ncbi:MAG TPA: hypothetical protein VFE54_05520 [Mucilaginibacter sp.]|nr:hypothetical protein [Mucilaginibacter sp.]